MDPRKVIILCGGRQTRWGPDHIRKHAVPVPATTEDENPLITGPRQPCIERAVDLLAGLAMENRPIDWPVTVSAQHQFDFFECRPNQVCLDFHLGDDVGETVAYHIERNAGSARRLVFLLGDVYWTVKDLRRLIEADDEEPALVTDYWDTFGFSFHANVGVKMIRPIREWGRTNRLRDNLSRFCVDWKAIEAKTWTQDFDIDLEHIQFLHGISKNKIFQKTKGQTELRRALRKRIKETR
jgi:hypothetical protein